MVQLLKVYRQALNELKTDFLDVGICYNDADGYFIVKHRICIEYRRRKKQLIKEFKNERHTHIKTIESFKRF